MQPTHKDRPAARVTSIDIAGMRLIADLSGALGAQQPQIEITQRREHPAQNTVHQDAPRAPG